MRNILQPLKWILIPCNMLLGFIPVIAYITSILLSYELRAQPAIQGVIDLKDHSWTQNEDLTINGSWHFVPYQFIPEADFRTGRWLELPRTQVQIPGALQEAPDPSGRTLDAKVWGTLVLDLQNLKPPFEEIGLQLRGDTAYSVYWLNRDLRTPWQKIMQMGVPGQSPETSLPQIAEKLGRIQLQGNGSYYLIIHISGYHYTRASIWMPPRLGSFAKLRRSMELQNMVEVFVSGMLFIMSIYYFSIFLHQRENKSAVWLGFYTIMNFMRAVATSGFLGPLLFPEPHLIIFEIFRKLEYGILMLMASSCAMFTVKAFKFERLDKFVLWNIHLSLLVAVFCLFTSVEVYAQYLLFMNLYVLAMICIILMITAHSLVQQKKGSLIMMIGMTLLAMCAVFDISVGMGFNRSASIFLTPFGITILIYCQGQVIASLFASAFRKAKNVSILLQEEVERQTIEIRSMLDNIPQGVMSLISPGIADQAYSRHLSTILETNDIAGRTLEDLVLKRSDLSSDQKDRIQATLATILDEDPINFELNSMQLPSEISLQLPTGKKIVQVTWSPVMEREHRVGKAFVTLHDITLERQLEEESLAQRQELEYIQEIISVPFERFALFIESSQSFLAENERLIKCNATGNAEVLKILFINMHTIKGAARTLGFHLMTGRLHEVEQYYAELQHKPDALWDLERLEADLNSVKLMIAKYQAINEYVRGRNAISHQNVMIERSLAEQLAALLKKGAAEISDPALEELTHDARQKLERLIFQNSRELFQDILGDTAKVAKDLGKEPPFIQIEGENFQLPYKAQLLLRNIFTHIVRNSVDHGIEPSQERQAQGKPPIGRILVQVEEEGDYLVIRYEDDGRGLALEGIRARGKELGLLPRAEQATIEELGSLIFHSGLSTANSVTELSGRGIGMDAVRRFIEEVGGTIELEFHRSRLENNFCPFMFCIRLPGNLYVRSDDRAEKAA